MLSQHSIISVGIIANETGVVVLGVILLAITAIHVVRSGAEINATARAEVTAVVTRCTAVMG